MKKRIFIFLMSLVSIVLCNTYISCSNPSNSENPLTTQYALENGYYSFSVGGLSSAPNRSIGSNSETFVLPYKSDVAWWGATGWAFCNNIYLMDGYDYMIQGTDAGKKVLVPGKYLSGFVSDSEPENPTFMKWDEENHKNSIIVNGDVWNDSNSDWIWYNNDISVMSILEWANDKDGLRPLRYEISEKPWKVDERYGCLNEYYKVLNNPNITQIIVHYDESENVATYEYNYSYMLGGDGHLEYYYMTFFLDLDESGSGYERGVIWR